MKRNDPMEVARRNPKSLRGAVNAKCWDCQGGDADPGPTRRVRECPITSCPLYPVRPYQRIARQRDADTDDAGADAAEQ